MNPLVEKMLIAQREGIDVRTLEQIFEHEAKCQSRVHLTECSKEVTHRFVSNHRDILVCADTAAYVRACHGRCETCYAPVEECWTIRPI